MSSAFRSTVVARKSSYMASGIDNHCLALGWGTNKKTHVVIAECLVPANLKCVEALCMIWMSLWFCWFSCVNRFCCVSRFRWIFGCGMFKSTICFCYSDQQVFLVKQKVLVPHPDPAKEGSIWTPCLSTSAETIGVRSTYLE